MTATEEAAGVDINDLDAQEAKLGETAKNTFLQAGERKKTAKAKLKEWDEFFKARGIDPDVQKERLLAAATAKAGAGDGEGGGTVAVAVGPAVPSQTAGTAAKETDISRETNFVMKIATEKPKEGFTLDEIIKAAVKAKVLAEDTKDARQPFYKAVFALKAEGKLVDGDTKREDKTIYVLKQG